MRRKKWAMVVFGVALFAVIFVAGFGSAVQHLWNLLMPEIFGLPIISFWQAVGLLSLSWLLFGGWRGMPGRRRPWGGGHRGRWEALSAEERERLMSGRHGCGPRGAAPAEAQ